MANDAVLYTRMEMRLADAEKKLARFQNNVDRNMDGVERRTSRAAREMETSMTSSASRMASSFKSLGLSIAGGLLAGGVIGLLEGLKQAALDSAAAVLEIGDRAKIAGLSFKAFQQLSYVADQNRVSLDALQDGFKELAIRADEFIVTGAGSGADAFKRLGYSATDLKEKLKAPDQLFLEIIGKLEKLDRAAQIRISDEVFGGEGGEQFLQLIARGERGIRDQIKAADDLGLMEDDLLKKAEKIDQAWKAVGSTIKGWVRDALIELGAATVDFLDRMREFENQNERNVNAALATTYRQLTEAKQALTDLQADKAAFPDDLAIDLNIDRAKERIEELTEMALRLRDILDKRMGYNPSAGPASPSPATNNTTRSSFYRPADQGDRAQSRDYTVAARGGFLDLIGAAEGTDKGRGYNETLGYGKFTGGDKNLVLMSLDDIDALQSKMLADPSNNFNSSALGRYQITRTTLRGLRERLGLSGSDTFDPAMQDRLAQQLLRQRGNDPAGLRNEWEGLRSVSDDTIRSAYDATSTGMAGTDSGIVDARKKAADKIKSYDDLIAKGRLFIEEQGNEASALYMTEEAAQRFRFEQQLLNDARQAGIDLTPEQTEKLKMLAAGMASAEARMIGMKEAQERLTEAAAEFQEATKDAAKGFISDLLHGASAADALKNALSRLGDQMLDKGLDLLFDGLGGTGKGGGGFLGNIIGAFFGGPKVPGLADGTPPIGEGPGRVHGPGGPRDDKVLHRLSNGEHVTRAAMAKKYRPWLDAINADRLPDLPALANGTPAAKLTRVPSLSGVGLSAPELPTLKMPDLSSVVRSRGSRDVVRLELKDDTGRMASIADQQIRTSSGTIVQVAVKHSLDQTRRHFASMFHEANERCRL